MRRLALAGLSLAVLTACQPANTELADEQKAEITSEFQQHRMDMYAAAERLEADEVMRSFARDAALISQGARITYDDYDAMVRTMFGTLQSQTVKVLDMRVDVLAPDAVANTDVIAVEATDADGNMSEATYVHTEVWVKRGDHWVMIHGQQALQSEAK